MKKLNKIILVIKWSKIFQYFLQYFISNKLFLKNPTDKFIHNFFSNKTMVIQKQNSMNL